jgi:MinD superfamily P-loop ATPase
MKIAIASGKGGTGKTTVAVNLAYFNSVALFDLDVEEPNDYVFIKGERSEVPVFRKVPEIKENCNGCGVCREVCEYSAIYVIDRAYTLPEVCHSCGACSYFCPEDAIIEVDREMGKIVNVRGYIELIYGELAIGEASPISLIRQIKKLLSSNAILDCPPGTSCPMVESVRDADFVILVAEPTPFSLHDLKIAVQVVLNLDLDFGVVINKDGLPFSGVEEYCKSEGIEILGKIPFSVEIARNYSEGRLLEGLKETFVEIYEAVT